MLTPWVSTPIPQVRDHLVSGRGRIWTQVCLTQNHTPIHPVWVLALTRLRFAGWPWASHLLSLSLSFLTYKIKGMCPYWFLRSLGALMLPAFTYQGLGFPRSKQFQTLDTQKLKGWPKGMSFYFAKQRASPPTSFLFHKRKCFFP